VLRTVVDNQNTISCVTSAAHPKWLHRKAFSSLVSVDQGLDVEGIARRVSVFYFLEGAHHPLLTAVAMAAEPKHRIAYFYDSV